MRRIDTSFTACFAANWVFNLRMNGGEKRYIWHAALFPTGYSGMNKISVGRWRDDAGGPMQVSSGPMGRRKVHFQAPPADMLSAETAWFLAWVNVKTGEPALARCHRLALVVPWHAGARRYQRANHTGRRAGQGAFLATLGAHWARKAIERAAGETA